MKKIVFLVIGMVLCLAVVGGVIAVEYFDAAPDVDNLQADTAIRLSLNDSTNISAFTLEVGQARPYTIVAEVEKSASAVGTGTLTVALADVAGDPTSLSAANVEIRLYSDQARQNLVKIDENDAIQVGAGTLTITGIDATTNYYMSITLLPKAEGSYTADELAAIGGLITISFVVA
ncbi:MAG: hypothetical protein IJX70_02265 [Clostridia bacterium]|nr:hypothetical protein [Clostridia bacterium]